MRFNPDMIRSIDCSTLDDSEESNRPHVPLTIRFGLRLRQLRKMHGFSQVQLSEYLGIDRSFISDLERGRKTISLEYLETIAQGFKITLSELMDKL